MGYDDEEYFLPLEDQRVFGAGIKRKRVQFIPSTEKQPENLSRSAPTTTASTPAPPGSTSDSTPLSIGDRYLSIVFSDSTSSSPLPVPSSSPVTLSTEPAGADDIALTTCAICNLPLSEPPPPSSPNTKYPPHPHESSIVHQASLPHSHPPSAVDRTRRGFKYLSSYGWDPDSRSGLGPSGSGIRAPIQAKVKHDTVGLGVNVKKLSVAEQRERDRRKPPTKLNAKQVRTKELETKKKAERLREMFYTSEDMEKYLGAA